jgi:hypothetical protein
MIYIDNGVEGMAAEAEYLLAPRFTECLFRTEARLRGRVVGGNSGTRSGLSVCVCLRL